MRGYRATAGNDGKVYRAGWNTRVIALFFLLLFPIQALIVFFSSGVSLLRISCG
jgi:hypothetical protein